MRVRHVRLDEHSLRGELSEHVGAEDRIEGAHVLGEVAHHRGHFAHLTLLVEQLVVLIDHLELEVLRSLLLRLVVVDKEFLVGSRDEDLIELSLGFSGLDGLEEADVAEDLSGSLNAEVRSE